jgi:muramoyltetrapeptide carboxypeptidase LdcA involved in peptidoglycan recycling
VTAPVAEDALKRHLGRLGVSMLYKLPLGHGKHLATIPLGVTATLDADARSLTIEQPGVAAATYTEKEAMTGGGAR